MKTNVPNSIIKSEDYLNSLKSTYPNINVPLYKFREWFSTKDKIFFDCEEAGVETCLEEKKSFKQYSQFKVFHILKNGEKYVIKDVIYPNIGNASLVEWIPRYEKNLKGATLMSLSAAGQEYVDELGFSYRID